VIKRDGAFEVFIAEPGSVQIYEAKDQMRVRGRVLFFLDRSPSGSREK